MYTNSQAERSRASKFVVLPSELDGIYIEESVDILSKMGILDAFDGCIRIRPSLHCSVLERIEASGYRSRSLILSEVDHEGYLIDEDGAHEDILTGYLEAALEWLVRN